MAKRNLLLNLLLIVGSTGFSLLLVVLVGESFFRLTFEATETGPPTDWYVSHESRGVALRPGDYSYFDIAAFRDVKVHINEFGIRHPTLSPAIESGKRRITVVGDSFIFGAALNANEIVSGQLQNRAGGQYEVVPVAVPGYGTGQQILLLEELISQDYEVGDHLVFVFFTNDTLDNVALSYDMKPSPRKPLFSVSEDGDLEHSLAEKSVQQRQRNAKNQGDRRVRESLFGRYLMYQAEVIAVRFPTVLEIAKPFGLVPRLPRRPGVISAWYNDGWRERWEVTARILEWLADHYNRALSAKVSIAFIPSPFQVEPAFQTMLASQSIGDSEVAEFFENPDRPQQLLRELCGHLGVNFIDTTSALRVREDSAPVYFPREGHLNERGAAIVADTLYAELPVQ